MCRLLRLPWLRRALVLALPLLLAGQTAILQIRVVEGDGAVQPAGARVPWVLSVVVTDETGKPVEGAAVSFRLPEEGPSGTFRNGLMTDVVVTGPDGRAALRGVRWNRIPGPFRIRVTAVKDQARAGTVVSQYLSDAPAARKSGPRIAARSKRRWLALTAVIAAAASAGFAAGWARNSKGQPAQPASPVKIGPPTISIGKP